MNYLTHDFPVPKMGTLTLTFYTRQHVDVYGTLVLHGVSYRLSATLTFSFDARQISHFNLRRTQLAPPHYNSDPTSKANSTAFGIVKTDLRAFLLANPALLNEGHEQGLRVEIAKIEEAILDLEKQISGKRRAIQTLQNELDQGCVLDTPLHPTLVQLNRLIWDDFEHYLPRDDPWTLYARGRLDVETLYMRLGRLP